MKHYFWNILISADQLANTLLGGDPDETISSRMGKRAIKGDRLGGIICRLLDMFDKGHCKKSIEEDEGQHL
jgi:hypothetical protein